MSSWVRIEKNDSAGALSKALPVRPEDRRMPSRRQAVAKALDVYWDPFVGVEDDSFHSTVVVGDGHVEGV